MSFRITLFITICITWMHCKNDTSSTQMADTVHSADVAEATFKKIVLLAMAMMAMSL